MKVRVAESAGFCFGVKRAVNLVYREADQSEGPVYTMGPIIHNDYVVNDLAGKGVRILGDDLLDRESGEVPPESAVIIVRSHGISKEMTEKLKRHSWRIVDATCPFVRKIHTVVREYSSKGHPVVIIGDPQHPEVIGIRGWCSGICEVVASTREASALSVPKDIPLCVVSQTTFNYDNFQEIVEIIEALGYHVVATNTICNATRERQEEALRLAEASDIMIVIGGKNSSNTQKLVDICRRSCPETLFVQSGRNLDSVHIRPDCCVGITAGASTPNTIIQEVSQHVRRAEFRTDAQRELKNN